ncbi:hypothetical protein [Piscibacillus salipiscarius]|uniref:hypothetical protein n=1 Tax=Piscibacillus salipiscarius TaxID=299480 RepID=UPI0006CF6A59|nr:hypothetical protein [Piscibacillus salipiscarius]
MFQNPMIIEYLYRSLIFLILIFCAYLILKPIILKLIKRKCIYTLNYLIISLCTTSMTLTVLALTNSYSNDVHELKEVLGSLWIAILILGMIFFITFVAKIYHNILETKYFYLRPLV